MSNGHHIKALVISSTLQPSIVEDTAVDERISGSHSRVLRPDGAATLISSRDAYSQFQSQEGV